MDGQISPADIAMANELLNDAIPLTDDDIVIDNICMNISDILSRKNHDYGNSVHSTYETYGMTAFLVRMQDKINRLNTLTKNEAMVADEKIEDTLMDLAGYAILAVKELREAK